MSHRSNRLNKRSFPYKRNRDIKKGKGSSTAGIMKGESCHRSESKNLYCSARGYKHKNYF